VPSKFEEMGASRKFPTTVPMILVVVAAPAEGNWQFWLFIFPFKSHLCNSYPIPTKIPAIVAYIKVFSLL
jgi:hypothetical protein